jgi:hypothetical protein
MKDNFQPTHPSKTIWVFRTSVTVHVDIKRLKPVLDRLMCDGDKWNFDLEDCDHILRVETKSLRAAEIIFQMEKAGYQCAELEDDCTLLSTPFIPMLVMNFQNTPPTPFLQSSPEITISSRSERRFDFSELTPDPSLTV